jgi:hypothetical protein
MTTRDRRIATWTDNAVTLLLIMAIVEWWGWAWYWALGFTMAIEAASWGQVWIREKAATPKAAQSP